MRMHSAEVFNVVYGLGWLGRVGLNWEVARFLAFALIIAWFVRRVVEVCGELARPHHSDARSLCTHSAVLKQ